MTGQLFFHFKAHLPSWRNSLLPFPAEFPVVSPGGWSIQVCPQVLPLRLPLGVLIWKIL